MQLLKFNASASARLASQFIANSYSCSSTALSNSNITSISSYFQHRLPSYYCDIAYYGSVERIRVLERAHQATPSQLHILRLLLLDRTKRAILLLASATAAGNNKKKNAATISTTLEKFFRARPKVKYGMPPEQWKFFVVVRGLFGI
jgi:hypothetical protein